MVYILPLLSILIGYLIAILLRPKNKKNLKLLLAFSGSFLLTLTVTHLLPEVYASTEPLHHGGLEHDHSHSSSIGIFIMVGIVFQIILEYFSKGAEHGHVHLPHKMDAMPWLLFISLCIHALLEGMPLSQNLNLAWGIAIHHLPIAVILTTFFINAGMDKKKILFFMLVFSLMTPLGTYVSGSFVPLQKYYAEISAIVVGILFHISSTIIFESNEDHRFNLTKLGTIILGVIVAYFV
ncbi:ZIP family metal transporter [Flavobacterium sp. HSC-61S13]|uniref:ZIP family metal transporter n=1 Tax=Flavobacterium sp. HSC-61S13 TaxID=2910963 RepID=UPI00209DD77A|nr:ZIP family metal transporter [Flavobacterium sp. HSC-61S13]MCP1994271.1 zinc transporter ZupT [Flavobacterium sp. HSC-61S13]